MGFLRRLILGSDRAAIEKVLNQAEDAERKMRRAKREYHSSPMDANAQLVQETTKEYERLAAQVFEIAPVPHR